MANSQDNLASTILRAASDGGWRDRVALREGDREWTYAQLADQVARVATAFRTLRMQPGDRVAIMMPDSLEAASAILGAIYFGAVAVPVSELGRAMEIRDILNDTGAVVAVAHASLQPTIEQIRSEVPSLRELLTVGGSAPGQRDFGTVVRSSAPAPSAAEVEKDDVALILYSAGARANRNNETAAPAVKRLRGVPHTHTTPLEAFQSFGEQFLRMNEHDRVFSVVRVSTAYGLGTGLLFPLLAGAESLLLPEQPTSKNVFAGIDSFEPTVMFATPSIYGQLARDAVARSLDRPLGSLRSCVSGAEDMPPRVIDRVRDVLGADVTVGYGLTEAFQFVIAGPAASGRPGACGKPVYGFSLRIMADEGDEEVGVDEIGTLQIKGVTIARGYWGEERSEPVEWFTTRDRFMVDADGNYYHCGRVDHLFKVGGKWVSPGEVEHALLAHEAVWECAAIGADDEDGLIKPMAFVVCNIGHEPSPELKHELREFVKKELAPYKYPRWIEFVDELPKGPHGKILRYKLHDKVKSSTTPRRAETQAPN
jgi:benzoate-CoA ligase